MNYKNSTKYFLPNVFQQKHETCYSQSDFQNVKITDGMWFKYMQIHNLPVQANKEGDPTE
jgi:hypothetical protein